VPAVEALDGCVLDCGAGELFGRRRLGIGDIVVAGVPLANIVPYLSSSTTTTMMMIRRIKPPLMKMPDASNMTARLPTRAT